MNAEQCLTLDKYTYTHCERESRDDTYILSKIIKSLFILMKNTKFNYITYFW